MSKFYKQALAIINSNSFDSRAIALRLAQENPSLFVKFAQPVVVEPAVVQPAVPSWFMHDVVNTVPLNIVQAIKNLRCKTGLGLWEAKQIVDEWRFGGDKHFLSQRIGHEIPEFSGKTWDDLVKAAKALQ